MSEWIVKNEKFENFQYTNIPITNNQKVLS